MNSTPDPSSCRIRSPRYDTAVGALLTDEKILQYAAKGYYGTEKKRTAEIELKMRALKKKEKSASTKLVRDLLEDIL